MLEKRRILIALAAGVFSASCASGGQGGASAASGGTTEQGGSRYLVSSAELATVGDLSAYDALVRLRPSFLRSRDVQTPTHQNPKEVSVFVDGARTEGVDTLKGILTRTVKEIRFFEPPEANTRFGTGNNGGVILVLLK